MATNYEISEILTLIAGCDTRFPAIQPPQRMLDGTVQVDPRITAWSAILGDIPIEDLRQATLNLVRQPMLQVMQPGHLHEEVKRIQLERAKDKQKHELTPPEGLEPGVYPLWLQATKNLIRRGVEPEAAMVESAQKFGGHYRRGELERRNVKALVQQVVNEKAGKSA